MSYSLSGTWAALPLTRPSSTAMESCCRPLHHALARATLRGTSAVSKARCFHAVDRERLLGAIEAAYGDTAPFDEAVRSLLSTRKRLRSRRRLCMAHELQRRGLLP